MQSSPLSSPLIHSRPLPIPSHSQLPSPLSSHSQAGVLKAQLSAATEQYAKERDEWHKERARLTAEIAEARRLSGFRAHLAQGGHLGEGELD